MKTAIKALMLVVSMSAPLVGMIPVKEGSREFFREARKVKNAAKDEAVDWGIGSKGIGYYWRKFSKGAGELCTRGLEAASQEINSLHDRYQYGDLRWNDTDMLVIEGALGACAMYISYKIYKAATRNKDKRPVNASRFSKNATSDR